MADNVTLPVTGTGTADVVQATDDIAGVQYPRVKLVDGTADSTAVIPGSTANGLLTDVSRFKHTQSAPATASWDSTTAVDTVLSLDVTNFASLSLTWVTGSGTLSAGAIVFEASNDGGTKWFRLAGYSSRLIDEWQTGPIGLGAPFATRDLSTIGSDAEQLLLFAIAGLATFRVRLQTTITGSATLALRLLASTAKSSVSFAPWVLDESASAVPVVGTVIDGDPLPGGGKPLLMAGQDGTNIQSVKTNSSGELQVGIVGGSVGLTDAELRATPVPVSGTVTANAGSGPFPVSDNGGSLTVDGTFFQATQPVSAAALPLPTGAATEATLATRLSESDYDAKTGSLTETAPATDIASSGLNGRLQRIAQRVTSLIALLPTALGANGGLKIEGVASGTVVPISAASLPLPSLAATSAKQDSGNTFLATIDANVATRLSEIDFDSKTGALTESAPANDTASSGLNGRLQRIAQRLTSLIGLLPAVLVGGRLDTNTGSWLGSTAPTVGQKTSANSVPVVVASDQSAVPVSGTFFQATQPVSNATLPLPTGAATETTLATLATQVTLAALAQIAATFNVDIGTLTTGVAALAKVSDTVETYTPNTIQPLSLNQEGRLRVATLEESYNFSSWGDPQQYTGPELTYTPLSAWGE